MIHAYSKQKPSSDALPLLRLGLTNDYHGMVARAQNNTQWLMPSTEITLPVQLGVRLDIEGAG